MVKALFLNTPENLRFFRLNFICVKLIEVEKPKIGQLFALFFVSSATLCLEVTLTRYFSISQEYHFAFLVVSIAFLGFGASGSFLFLSRRIALLELNSLLTLSSLFFSITILSSFFVSNSLPFDFFSLSWDRSQIFYIFVYYFFLSIPFFFAGLTISSAVTRLAREINKVYFFDLLGAGTGSLLASFIFLPHGDRGVMVIISLVAVVGSLLFSLRTKPFLRMAVILVLAAELCLLILTPSWLSFHISPFKALPLALRYPKTEHILRKWNAISQIDVIKSPAVRFAPGLSLIYSGTLPPQLGLSVDGGELTAITHFSSKKDPCFEFLHFLPSSFAYSILKKPSTLIIEARGGLDIIQALALGGGKITVIESNPLIVKILSGELSSFSGDIYRREDISLILAESRAGVQQIKENFDLIVFSLNDVFAPSSTGIHGFRENYLYTLDSFCQIIEKLNPGGIISTTLFIIPPPRQEAKLLATWIEALEKKGKDPASHLLSLRSWGSISYFIKESPFTAEEIKKLKNFAAQRFFDLVYYPGIKKEETNIHNEFNKPLYYELTLKLLSPPSRKKLYQDYLFGIKPATDNKPFFFNSFKPSRMRATFLALGKKWLPLLQGGFLIPLILVQAALIAFILILVPLLWKRERRSRKKCAPARVFLYFSTIGTAFMFVEIIWIQKFILFLGHPLYSISLTIFSLLLSSGLGSFFSKKILAPNLKIRIGAVFVFLSMLIITSLFSLPHIFRGLIGLGLGVKIVVAFSLIFPLGFLMGFPFPTGIRILEMREKKLIPWAWATNAFASVISSILALMIAQQAGYNLVLFLAAAGYLFAFPLLRLSYHGDKTDA
ncbi:MAG: hypothetical protein ACE5LC_02325 [Candidatus Aminicenantales bacterium]